MSNDSDKIFVIQPEGGFGEVARMPYESEDLLQRLLEDHPELLAGDMLSPGKRARFILVGREVGVPDSEGRSDRWSLDHLFIDQDGTPTFVEVKRSTDTRIRREVVGQMLDYAANGQKYWPVDRIRSLATQRAGGAEALTEAVLDMIGRESDEDAEERVDRFWMEAAEKLRTGQVRLVFVADSIPPELKRILEFLNEQMPRLHVVGLELVQYHAEGLPRILVPRVVGQTEAARELKIRTAGPRLKIDEATFLASCHEDGQGFFTELINEAKARGLELYWGERGFSARLRQEVHQRRGTILYGWPPGYYSAPEPVFQVYLHDSVFSPEESNSLRQSLLETGFSGGGRYTLGIPISDRTIEAARQGLKTLLDWEEGLRSRG
jgi:hypothetical protein